jgi:hypothetical protein
LKTAFTRVAVLAARGKPIWRLAYLSLIGFAATVSVLQAETQQMQRSVDIQVLDPLVAAAMFVSSFQGPRYAITIINRVRRTTVQILILTVCMGVEYVFGSSSDKNEGQDWG